MNTNIFADAEEFYSGNGSHREERLELRKNSRGEADVIVCEQQVIRNTFIQEKQIIGNQLNNEDWSDIEKTQRKMCLKLNLTDNMKSEQFGSELSTPTDQTRRKSVESQRKSSLDGGAINSNRKTPSSIPRQLIGETFSPSPTLARSPAMHEGFRAKDWRVERTPINTPEANIVTNRLPLLSDDEDDEEPGETDSVNTETDPISKGSGTSSFLPSSVDISESKTGSSIPEKDNSSTKMHLCSSSMSGDAAGCRLTASESPNVNVSREIQGFEMQQHSEQSILRVERSSSQDERPFVEDDTSLPAAVVQPPADFADSPIRSPPQKLQTQQSSIQSTPHETEDEEVLTFEQVADIDNNPPASSQGHEPSSKSKCGSRENFTLKESYHHPELVVCQRQGIAYFKKD